MTFKIEMLKIHIVCLERTKGLKNEKKILSLFRNCSHSSKEFSLFSVYVLHYNA